MSVRGVLRTLAAGCGYTRESSARTNTPTRKTVWSIGIYQGNSLTNFHAADGPHNPVLTRADVTDVCASFVADPFMIHVGGTWHMFFEVYNRERLRGEIGLATSNDAIHWQYERIVLREPFHLSYPYVFEFEGETYLIPESRDANAVRIYRASLFPYKWEFVQTLLTGPLADASPVQFEGRWWLFADTREQGQINNTLRLFSSNSLMDGWAEHPKSPIIAQNPHLARPGGRVIVNGCPIRFTQDCYPIYGTRLHGFEIHRLTPSDYEEKALCPIPILSPGDSDWNKAGMHHIDPHQLSDGRWIACVDGFFWEYFGTPEGRRVA